MSGFHERILETVRRIPAGRVATYGQIAGLAGSPRSAMIVGQILRRHAETHELAWQRVVNRNGRISIVNIEYPAALQAELLRNEGITVTKRSGSFYIDLACFQWKSA